MRLPKVKAPWSNPTDAPVIEQSIHDLIVSIFRMQPGTAGDVEIVPISPGAEAKRGWDAAVIEAVPLYLQYKLPDSTSRPAQTQSEAYEQRNKFGFNDSEVLFHFPLRAKAAQEAKSQHEFLVELQKQGERAYYVSTTLVDLKRLRKRGSLIDGRPWVNEYSPILHRGTWQLVGVPFFQDLICIPPHAYVDDPPENHRFFFNADHEVSLHSEPEIVESLNFLEVLRDQVEIVQTTGAINADNIDEHVNSILVGIAGGTRNELSFERVRSYFDALVQASNNKSHLMGSLRALARVTKQLTGVDVLLTVRKNINVN